MLPGIAGCAQSTGTGEVPASEQDEDDDPRIAMITDNQGTYFDPKGLHVDPGTTLRFVNESGNHGTTAYHPGNEGQPNRIPTDAEPWDSEIYAETDKHYDVTLDVEGVYDYYCPPHESMGMVGRIVVGARHAGPGTTPPDDLPPGAQDALPSVADIVERGEIVGP